MLPHVRVIFLFHEYKVYGCTIALDETKGIGGNNSLLVKIDLRHVCDLKYKKDE